MKSESRFLLTMVGLVVFIGAGLAALNYYTRPPQPEPVKELEIKLADVLSPNRPEKGNPDANIVIVEFSDLQCPSCSRGAETVDRLMLQYPEKIRLIFRHYPLDTHERAMMYAQAAEAAHQQGKFWQMHDLIFSEQTADRKRLEEFARSVGLDIERFRRDMNSQQTNQAIQEDKAVAQRFGISSTPTYILFVNGKGRLIQGHMTLASEVQRIMEGE